MFHGTFPGLLRRNPSTPRGIAPRELLGRGPVNSRRLPVFGIVLIGASSWLWSGLSVNLDSPRTRTDLCQFAVADWTRSRSVHGLAADMFADGSRMWIV